MQQLDLTQGKDRFAQTHTKRNDPPTSAEAAEAIYSGRYAEQKAIVLEACRDHPGLTSKQLAKQCNLDRHMVARRLPDLALDHKVFRGARENGGVTWWPK